MPEGWVPGTAADEADEMFRQAWDRLGPRPGLALVALGEYGRRWIGPASELELLVVGGQGAGEVAEACSEVAWAAGKEAGILPVTPAEAEELARSSIERETSMLDARLVAGDRDTFDRMAQGVLAWTLSSPEAFLERLGGRIQSRRLAGEDACGAREPDLRFGRGGLEDLAAIGWIERVMPAIAGTGGGDGLAAAGDFLQGVRAAIHRVSGYSEDLLPLGYREPVAAALYGNADPEAEAVLMREIYTGCRLVAMRLSSLIDPDAQPGSADAFASAYAAGGDGSSPWSAGALEAFAEVLRRPDSRASLEHLDWTGLLSRAIPELEQVRGLAQSSVYHLRAVDSHLFEVAGQMGEMLASPAGPLQAVVELCLPGERDELLLASLFHDIGKGSPADHSEAGEGLAMAALKRMGLGEQERMDVAWLVRHHLLLSRSATRRDIGDPDLIAFLADAIGSRRRLRDLYLLTIADGLGTGPAAWGPWKATLVARLFSRIDLALSEDELVGRGIPLPEARRAALEEALEAYPPQRVAAHLDAMPAAWLVSQSVSSLVEQSRLMIEFSPGGAGAGHHGHLVAIHASPDAEAGIWELTVIAGDRPGLFHKISGALALHDLNVLGAEVFTREDGVALEAFRVEALGDEEHRFEHVREDAEKALQGRISLDMRLAEKRRSRPHIEVAGAVAVALVNDASSEYSVVEVRAPDRIGLLYSVTRALLELDLDIRLAKVSTYGHEVVDSFYVRDLAGRKVTDPEQVLEIEKSVRHELSL